ncbi:MAG: cyclic nucleotide-binding domain-containing protein [Spirochaetes bacterium]|nr:cyclic nucleotide-binding domain-containing protein [Spirochaetota bacterium]
MKEQKRMMYKAGSYIYIEGDEDVDEVYIVEKGQVEFKSTNERMRSHGSSAGSGDVFGFVSSLSRRPRMETAFAKVNSSILVFTREKFLSLLQKNSEIAIKLLNSYADELRLYDTMIFPLGGRKEVFSSADFQLFSLGVYYFKSKMNANALYILNRYLELYPAGENSAEAKKIIGEIKKGGISRTPDAVPDGIYRRYADRQIIFCEHEPGDHLFIIKKGRVKIVKYHNDSEIILSVLKEGDIFGELAIVSDKPRNATAVSFGTTIVLPIDKDSMVKLIKKSSDLMKRIFNAISQRVWFTFIRMESKFYQKPITRIYAFLENKLIEDNISLKSREPHTFNFGIDELIKMTNTPADKVAASTMEITKDQNLTFNLGQTVIENPSLVSSKARYHRSRDHLYETGEGEKEELPPPRVQEESASEFFEDISDMRVPEAASPDEPAGPSSTLFEELEGEVKID